MIAASIYLVLLCLCVCVLLSECKVLFAGSVKPGLNVRANDRCVYDLTDLAFCEPAFNDLCLSEFVYKLLVLMVHW